MAGGEDGWWLSVVVVDELGLDLWGIGQCVVKDIGAIYGSEPLSGA